MLLYLFLCARFFFHTTQPLCSNFSILLPHNVPYGNAAAPRAFDSGYVTVAEDDRTVQATCWERATETKTWSYLPPPLEREGGITGLLHTIFKKIGFFVCIVLILPFLSSLFQIVILLVLLGQACRGGLQQRQGEPSEYPDGYFPFEESPSRTPPKVRRPPYAQADVDCPGILL